MFMLILMKNKMIRKIVLLVIRLKLQMFNYYFLSLSRSLFDLYQGFSLLNLTSTLFIVHPLC